MFNSRIAKTFICLALVFVLVFNIYALPTKAVAAGTVVTVGAALFVTAALVALGISAGNSLDDFNSIRDNCTTTLQQAGVIGDYVTGYLVDGKVNFWQRLIDAVRSWTYEEEIITSSFSPPDVVGTRHGEFGMYFSIARGCSYAFYLEYSSGNVILCYDSNPIILDAGSVVASDGEFTYWSSGSMGTWKGSSFNTSSFVSVVSFGLSCNGQFTTYDVSLGDVAPDNIELSAHYADWAAGSISVPGTAIGGVSDEEEPMLPLGIGETLDETMGMSQAQVQSGVGSYTGEIVAPDDGGSADPDVSGAVTAAGLAALFSQLQDFLTGRFQSLVNLLTVVRDWTENWWDKLGTTFPALMSEWWSDVWTHVDDSFDTVLIGIRDGLSGIRNWTDTWWDDLVTTFPDAMSKWWEDVWTHVDDTFDSVLIGIRDGIAGIKSWADTWYDNLTIAIPEALAKWWEAVWADARSIPDVLTAALENLKTGILEGIEAVFIPPEDYLSDKLDAIKDKYSFVDSILATAAAIGSSISTSGSEPPVIYAHLEDADSDYSYGGTVAILDMNWYAEYKPTVDKILAAFLWVCFAWKTFKKAPGIISGTPDDVDFSRLNLSGIVRRGTNGLRRLR